MINFNVEPKTAYIVTDFIARKYFSGISVDEGVLLITPSGRTYLTDMRYFHAVEKELKGSNVKCAVYNGVESVKKTLDIDGVENVYLDYGKATVKEYKEYLDLGYKVLDCENFFDGARAVKNEFEIESIIKACAIIQKVYYQGVKSIREGITEKQLQKVFEDLMIEYGAEGTSFDTIVAFGENSAVPHHKTGDTPLKKNSVVLVDMGCKVNGYCSDITRTAFYGVPDKKFIDCYRAVLTANQTAIENVTDKTFTNDADAFARSSLIRDGIGENFTHSLGHGVGLEIHEYPTLSPKKRQKLENGMVFTIEPGVYFAGEFGIRIEDVVMLKDGKTERLYTDDKNLKIL